MIRAAFLLLLLPVAAPAHAQTRVQAPPPLSASTSAQDSAAVRKQLGYDLAKLLNTEAMLLALTDRALSEDLPKAMLANADVKALEESYPGVTAAMIDAMRPIMLDFLRSDIPDLWSRLGELYADNLSEAEIKAALAFYGSPTGARIIELMLSSVDFAPMLTEMAAKEKYEMTADQISATTLPAAKRAVGKLSAAELAEAERFGRSSEGRKVVALTPKVNQLVVEWSNQPTPELDARLEKATIDAAEKFLGQKITP